MDDTALARAFNNLTLAETTPTGLPNGWHLSVRHVPMNPAGDMVFLVHPQSEYICSEGPANISCLPTSDTQANVVVPLLLNRFVKGVHTGPTGEPLPNMPVVAPARLCTNDSELARAIERKFIALGIRQELCTIHAGTVEENETSDKGWRRTLSSLVQMAGSCGGCKRPASSFPTPLSHCARCRSAWYCSRACQKRGWKEHKDVCGTLPKMDTAQFYINVAHTIPEARALAQSMNLALPGGRADNFHGMVDPVRRLVLTGKDTPENLQFLFGREWKDQEDFINEQRILVLLSPPQGSPAYVLTSSRDEGAPAPTPRPATAEEEQKIQTVRNLQTTLAARMGSRQTPSTADMRAVLSSFGANWDEMLPMYQLATNTMDQGVRLP